MPLEPGDVAWGGDLADVNVQEVAQAGAGAYLRWQERRQQFKPGKEPVVLFAIVQAELDKLTDLIRDCSHDPELRALNVEFGDVLFAMRSRDLSAEV